MKWAASIAAFGALAVVSHYVGRFWCDLVIRSRRAPSSVNRLQRAVSLLTIFVIFAPGIAWIVLASVPISEMLSPSERFAYDIWLAATLFLLFIGGLVPWIRQVFVVRLKDLRAAGIDPGKYIG